VTRQAMMIAFNRLFSMVCFLFVLSLPLVYLLKEQAKQKEENPVTSAAPATDL
jgi:hypothetical protein